MAESDYVCMTNRYDSPDILSYLERVLFSENVTWIHAFLSLEKIIVKIIIINSNIFLIFLLKQ